MKLPRNGYVFILVFLTLTTSGLSTKEVVSSVQDLCRYNRHIDDRYMDDNQSFQLNINSTARSDGNDKLMLQKFKSKCILRFKVCSSCHLSILIQNMVIPSCSGNCSCNHFVVQEPLSDYVSRKYCGEHSREVLYFESKTKIVYFDFVQSVHKMFYVSLTFNVSSNVYIFTEDVISRSKYIETPHFPATYPPDYSAEYHFKATRFNDCIQLLFIDFQLSRWSYIEITGHNKTHTEMFYGDKFRPPAIISDGPSLTVRFIGNDEMVSNKGFRAVYTYVQRVDGKLPKKPNTNCGGANHSNSGILALQSSPNQTDETFDCIWLIPPDMFLQHFHFLSASILEFKHMGLGTSLEFREGLTSKSKLKGLHRCTDSTTCQLDVKDEITAEASSGLYIRFRGTMRAGSSLVIAYHIFKLSNCSSEEFSCGDGRCLNILLVCDGFNHCMNGSDELNCTVDTTTQPTPAVRFAPVTQFSASDYPAGFKPPKMKRVGLDGSSGFLAITVIGTCGLLTVVLLFSLSVYNQYKRRIRLPAESLRGNNFAALDLLDLARPPSISRVPIYCPVRDRPPPYEHVITFNERYPPLFYTRPACSGEELSEMGSLPKFHHSCKNLCSSNPETSFNELPYLSNDSLVIQLDCSMSLKRFKSLGVSLVTRRLRRSLSLDLRANHSMEGIENCMCNFSSLLRCEHHACSLNKPFSRSAPCNHYPAHPESSNCHCSDVQLEESCDGSFYNAGFSSDTMLPAERLGTLPLPRQKTHSF